MGYPDFITRLPQADLPFPSVNGYMLRSDDGLQVFFHFPEETVVPMHSHGAQWGIIVEGGMEFTVGDVTKTYRAGDSYVIGAGQMHGGVIQAGTRLIDFFEEPERYKPKA